MERDDLVTDVSRRLLAASSLGPEVVDAAVHACRVAIGKTVLRHAEERARCSFRRGRQNQRNDQVSGRNTNI